MTWPRRRRPTPPPRPDRTRIAVLEWELFGVQPTPGTVAAFAVGARRLSSALAADRPPEVGGHASTAATILDLPPPPAWMVQPAPEPGR